MLKKLTLIITLAIATLGYAQSARAQTQPVTPPSAYRYCVLNAFAGTSGKGSVRLDVGSGGTEIGITAEKRESINAMRSGIDALNLLIADGWEVAGYSAMQGGAASILSCYLLRRPAR